MKIGLCLLLLTSTSVSILSQTTENPLSRPAVSCESPSGVTTSSPTALLPELDKLEAAAAQADLDIGRLHIEKWKTNSGARSAAQADAASVQRNLTSALPGLIVAVRSAPEDLNAAFKLYRNLNALYDVFGALTEASRAFRPKGDYEALAQQLQVIGSIRRKLGEALEQLTASIQQELRLLRDQVSAQQQQLAAASAAAPPPKEVVVPASEPPKNVEQKKKKNASKKPASAGGGSRVVNVEPPTLSSLRITGGTPGAEVVLDGNRLGQIDSNGNFELPNVLKVGEHTITLAKQNFESRTIADIPVRGQSPLLVPNAALIPWPTLGFEITPRNASIRYHRLDDPLLHDATPSARIPLPPGEYEILVAAPGFQEFRTQKTLSEVSVTFPSTVDVTISVNLVPIADYEFLDPNQIRRDGLWIRSKNPGEFIYLKPAFLQQNLVFAKPGKTSLGNKSVEWVIEVPEEHTRVQYELNGQRLMRKLVVGGQASDKKEARADAASTEQTTSLSLHLRVDGGHITITNDRGVVLDDYTAEGHDLSSARIGIKTDSQFRVESDNH